MLYGSGAGIGAGFFLAGIAESKDSRELALDVEPQSGVLGRERNALHERADAPLPKRAVAAWYVVGTDRCRSTTMRERRGNPMALFDSFCEAGVSETVVEIAREGFRKTNEMLSPLLPLIWREGAESTWCIRLDDLPDEEIVGQVPCWAYDMHVRQGNQALDRFLESNCETVRWVLSRVPGGERTSFLGGILFRVESGLVDQRLQWGVGERLRRSADLECHGLRPDETLEISELLRRDLPTLNVARRQVTASEMG